MICLKVLQLQHKLVETEHYVSHQSRASWPQKPSQIFMKEGIFFFFFFLGKTPSLVYSKKITCDCLTTELQ